MTRFVSGNVPRTLCVLTPASVELLKAFQVGWP